MKLRVLLIVSIFFLSACTGIQTRRGSQPKTVDGPFESGPETIQDSEPVPQRKKLKMALVLGPGAFKTFAYPSFLKALSQSGVQVDEIIGIEWGALSAAFYANNGKPHEAEWKVFKMKKSDVEDSSLFGGDEAIKVSKFREYLKTNFGSKSMNNTSIAFSCPVLRINRGTVDWSKHGELWRRVEICMASAPNYQPTDDAVPSLFAMDQVAKNLKRKGYEIIILVNVLGAQGGSAWKEMNWVTRAYWAEARRHIWQAKSQYSDVFEIDTGKYGPFDFKAKAGLKGIGEKAGRDAAKELVEKYSL